MGISLVLTRLFTLCSGGCSSSLFCFLVGSPLCMFTHFLVVIKHQHVGIGTSCLLSLLHTWLNHQWSHVCHTILLLFDLIVVDCTCVIWLFSWSVGRLCRLLCFTEISSAPISKELIVLFGCCTLRLTLSRLHFVFKSSSLIRADLLILLLGASIKFTWSRALRSTHLFSHHLGKGIITSTWHKKQLLWFLCFLFFCLFLNVSQIRLFEKTRWAWLPLSKMKLSEFEVLDVSFSCSAKNIDRVVNFDLFIQDACHKVSSIWCPFDTNCTL